MKTLEHGGARDGGEVPTEARARRGEASGEEKFVPYGGIFSQHSHSTARARDGLTAQKRQMQRSAVGT